MYSKLKVRIRCVVVGLNQADRQTLMTSTLCVYFMLFVHRTHTGMKSLSYVLRLLCVGIFIFMLFRGYQININLQTCNVVLYVCILRPSMFFLYKIILHRIVLVATQMILLHLTTATCFKPVYGFINPQTLEYSGNYLNRATCMPINVHYFLYQMFSCFMCYL
jgi:hypothetical protein